MSGTLKEFYPAVVALALVLSLLYDGSLFIMTIAAAIAALPLAYAQDANEIARQVRARVTSSEAGSDDSSAPG